MLSDEKWMHRALQLARRGEGRVHPNPMVGAVLVKNGRVVGEGYHRAYGQAHAEVEALLKAGRHARGATLYVTLEPCSHWGKTPPCSRAVIEAGVRKVVAAMKDPNPKVSGRGFAELKRARISVTSGVGETQARQLNRAFIIWVTERRPFVTLKMATSLDGKSSTITGESKWITGPKARRAGHELRAQVDAIAVGVRTVLKDNPTLSAHGAGRDPVRIIFDSQLRTPPSSKMLRTGAPVWILSSAQASSARRKLLTKKGVMIFTLSVDRSGHLRLKEALALLASQGIAHLLIEGGATLAGSFLNEKKVDEVAWFIAPLIVGSVRKLSQASRLKELQIQWLENDMYIQGRVR